MKTGDKVRFLNETGGGIITEFLNDQMVKVLTEDGFEFPVLKKEVIVVSASPEDFEGTGRKNPEPEEEVKEEKMESTEKQRTLADYLDKKRKIVITNDLKKKEIESVPPAEEVDLHIHHILPDCENLTPGEILEAQMARFTTALNGAIRNRQKKIVFIHGKGEGKLKYEIRKKLESDYPRLTFQDASFKEYGYGATLVIIK
jgi:dsDNA-specific endonuclease/ATPase MutS2